MIVVTLSRDTCDYMTRLLQCRGAAAFYLVCLCFRRLGESIVVAMLSGLINKNSR
jgi:hypothetical protein